MNLLYKLPPCESAVLSSSGEEPVYCIPCDISNGRIAKDWLAVTKTRVFLLRGGKIDRQVMINTLTDARCGRATTAACWCLPIKTGRKACFAA